MKIILPPLFLIAIVLVAGCTSYQLDALIKASPAVKNFISDYPNAEIITILVSKENVSSSLESIQKDCGSDFSADKYYKAVLDDKDSGSKLSVWINERNLKVACVVKENGSKQTSSTTIQTTTSISSSTSTSISTTTSSTTTSSTTTTIPPTTTTSGCSSNSGCGYKQICTGGKCVDVDCTTDSQCSGCKRCSSNSCVSCGHGPYGCYC